LTAALRKSVIRVYKKGLFSSRKSSNAKFYFRIFKSSNYNEFTCPHL